MHVHSSTSKPTLTVGIAAHNEERSIRRVLRSLLSQHGASYQLESIVVLCDGCTDSTASRVQPIADNDARVQLIDDGKRCGKIGRVNWLCANITSDILVILDADIEIRDKDVLEKFAVTFKERGVGLVSGLHIPKKARNFAESIFVTWDMIWMHIRTKSKNKNTIHNIAGCNFAMSRKMYSGLQIPPELVAEDEYVYFESQKRKLKYRFEPEIHVYYQLPGTLTDYLKQSVRFISTKERVKRHFYDTVANVPEAYSISNHDKIDGIWIVMKQRPLRTVLAIMLQVIARIYINFRTIQAHNGVWETIKSTK